MKKTLLIIGAVAILGILAAYSVPLRAKRSTTTSALLSSGSSTSAVPLVVAQAASNSPVATTSASSTVSSTASPSQSNSGSLKDGSYVGDSSSNPYGDTQIKLTISGGKIADITAISYPSSDRHSLQISLYSLPQLKQEILAAQSASIDSISGASYTSRSYAESIQAALNQAKV